MDKLGEKEFIVSDFVKLKVKEVLIVCIVLLNWKNVNLS